MVVRLAVLVNQFFIFIILENLILSAFKIIFNH